MNPLWLLTAIFIAFAGAAGFMWTMGVKVSMFQIILLTTLFALTIIFALIWKAASMKRKSMNAPSLAIFGDKLDDKAKLAEQHCRNFWKSFRGEEVTHLEGKCTVRAFGKDRTAWGFTMHRVPEQGSIKPGAPITFVIANNPWEIRDWDDNPVIQKMNNPFLDFSAGYSGAPFSGMNPDMDASFSRYKYGGGRVGTSINIAPRPGTSAQEFLEGRRREND
jgi:hypothetical protein